LNSYLLATVLGLIEGLTEFLPVSSTAHLRLSEALLGIDLSNGYWKMFTIVIQLGPIICLPIYFWKRITAFFASFPGRSILTHPISLTAIAFVVTSATSLPLQKVIGKNLESLYVMAGAFIIGGIVMWAVDAKYGGYHAGASESEAAKELEGMSLGQAIWIGLCQTLAPVFPGTSRSMATIAGGQISGLSRTAALEFSFLLSIPTMAAATGYDLLKFVKAPAPAGSGATPENGWILVAIGFVISFVVAYAVVAWFMNWVKHRGFIPFAIYRIFLGAAVLVWALNGTHLI
jgi:undecaprenyl-diphosphatase